MRRPDPLVEIEAGVRGDTAAALGRAGRSLRLAVDALVEFDRCGGLGPKERKALLHAAADALWKYTVQKEAIGITDNTRASEIYGVTAEMYRIMGTRFEDESSEERRVAEAGHCIAQRADRLSPVRQI